MKYVIRRVSMVNNLKKSVIVLIQDGAIVRQTEVILTKSIHVNRYIKNNIQALFDKGSEIDESLPAMRVFKATELKSKKNIHLEALISMFEQIESGGELLDAVGVAQQAYQNDPDVLASAQKFASAYRSANEKMREKFVAAAIFSMLSIISGDNV